MPIGEWVGREGGAVHVFVHGSPGDRRIWRAVLEHAPVEARCALVDLPDHGDAPPEPSLDPRRLELDVEAVVRGIGQPVALVGHGLGAWACARVLAALGDRVERTVLISGFASTPPAVGDEHLAMAAELESGELPLDEARVLLLRRWLGAQLAGSPIGMATRALLDLPVDRLARTLRRQAAATAGVPPYPTIATIVHATNDPTIPLAEGEALAELGDRALLITVESDAHALPLSEAKEIAELVFQRAEPPSP